MVYEYQKSLRNMKNEPLICLPGQRLSICDETYTSGQGTYQRQGYIYSMLAGTVDIVEKNGVKVIEVHSSGEQTVIPTQGDIVTAQVYIITQQYAKCYIKCIGDTVLRSPFRAVVRKEYVRAAEKDRVEIYKSFRPGDIILARVIMFIIKVLQEQANKIDIFCDYDRAFDLVNHAIELPITEAHSYQLTTAENELGVVIAHSEHGYPMVPISWTEMQCPKTLVKEPRKVAKVVPENIDMEGLKIDEIMGDDNS